MGVKRGLIASMLFAASLLTEHVTARADELVDRVSGWDIRISDEYHGCVATTAYQDGTRVTFGVDGIIGSKFINFSNLKWDSYPKGSVYEMKFLVLGVGTFSGFSHTIVRDGATTFEIGELGASFIDAFEAADAMRMYVEDHYLTNFDLTGTTAAFGAVVQCQNRWQ